MMNKVTPFITFDGRGAEAIKFYCSLFKHSKIHNMETWGPGGPVKEGSLINATFELDGQMFMAMDVDGGFPQGDGFSIYVNCQDQAEVDRLWEGLLSEGGKETACGWLVDRFGFSWQIIPRQLVEYLSMPDSPRKQAVMDAMLKMKKIVVAELDAAYTNA
jgi:predicted 3-demethylubiquinone-9 3-methyltransferase (glyoxalase superfamily)